MGDKIKSASSADRCLIPPVEFVKILRIVLLICGVRVTHDQKDKRNFSRGPLFYIGFAGLVLCTFSESTFVILSILRGQADFRQNMFTICCVMSTLFALFFCVKMLFHGYKFVEIAKKFELCFPKTFEEQTMFQVARYVKQSNVKTLLFCAVQISAILGFNAFPMLDIVFVYFRDHRWEVDFLFALWYPFDPYARGVFEVCYFFELAMSPLTIMMMISYDLIMCAWIEQLCMHLEQLKQAFTNFNSSDGDGQIEKAFIKKHVLKHMLTLELAEKLDDIFSVKVLVNFFVSAVLLCFIAFLVIASDMLIENAKYFLLLILLMSQIYLICYLGDRVTVACAEIGYGIYGSGWYNQSLEYQKSLLILHRRCLRDVYLTAFMLWEVGMPSFASIMSAAWRFLTILNTMYHK